MLIIGCDYHPSVQQIAWADAETGECGEKRLMHSDGEAERFYRELKQRGVQVRVGMEATGHARWCVGRRCLYKWQAKLDHLESGEEASRTNSHESSYRQQVHRLKRLLAEKTLEVDFFKGALRKVKARRQKSGDSGEMVSTSKSEK